MKKAAISFASVIAFTAANAKLPKLSKDANSKIVNAMKVQKKALLKVE